MRISYWSSDVCSSDLNACWGSSKPGLLAGRLVGSQKPARLIVQPCPHGKNSRSGERPVFSRNTLKCPQNSGLRVGATCVPQARSEEHTSELQSLMRLSYAVFCLQKNTCH